MQEFKAYGALRPNGRWNRSVSTPAILVRKRSKSKYLTVDSATLIFRCSTTNGACPNTRSCLAMR